MSLIKTTPVRYLVIFSLLILALLAVTLWAAFKFVAPLPPRTVFMTTGPADSAHHAFGLRYQTILAREGIELRLLVSIGEVENLKRLGDPRSGVSVGFVLGADTKEVGVADLASLGTLFYEPVWIFHRTGIRISHPDDLRGRRLGIGPEGSSTRKAVSRLLEINKLAVGAAQLLPLGPSEAAAALRQGQIDLAAMVAPWESPVVRTLLGDPSIETFSYPRADAYVALFPHLSKLVVPAGVGDMAANRPPSDVVLIAPKSTLAVRHDLHPAIQYLLLEAATQIHSEPGIFQKAGQFPAPESVGLPLTPEARRYYQSGPTFLLRYLPFWAAVLVGRALVLAIPILAVVVPLIRFTPRLFSWLMRRRIYRHYDDLRSLELELELDRRKPDMPVEDLLTQLDLLDSRLSRLKTPTFLSDRLYLLRQHVQLIRDHIEARQQGWGGSDRTEGTSIS